MNNLLLIIVIALAVYYYVTFVQPTQQPKETLCSKASREKMNIVEIARMQPHDVKKRVKTTSDIEKRLDLVHDDREEQMSGRYKGDTRNINLHNPSMFIGV